MKHTPGPWKALKSKEQYKTRWVIDSESRACMAVIDVPDINSDKVWQVNNLDAVHEWKETLKEVECNVNLFAAASDMFAVLKEVRFRLSLGDLNHIKDEPWVSRLNEVLSKVEGAE